MAIDGPVATHLADWMTDTKTETETIIQGTGVEDHALHIVGGEMIMIHTGGTGIAHCQLTVAIVNKPRKYHLHPLAHQTLSGFLVQVCSVFVPLDT